MINQLRVIKFTGEKSLSAFESSVSKILAKLEVC